MNFWIPPTKYQCIAWLVWYYKNKYCKVVYQRKSKKELQGWIASVRRRDENA